MRPQSESVKQAARVALRIIRTLHVDVESASEVDLTVVGLDKYSKHPSTRFLMIAWAFDDGPVQQWSVEDGVPIPAELTQALRDPAVRKWAWNAQFEQVMFTELLLIDTPIEQWRCGMVNSYMLGLPGALDKTGAILRLPDGMLKLKDGKRLIRRFCVRQKATKKQPSRWYTAKTHPEDWALFCEYNRQDVVAERFIVDKRLARYPIPDSEWKYWYFSYRTNSTGWPVDRRMLNNACKLVIDRTAEGMSELKDITKLKNPNSGPQFGPWARARGYPYGDLRKNTIARAIEDPKLIDIRDALQLRAELQKTSVKKYITIQNYISEDDRLRWQYQFSGAKRTGRTSGRGAQLQNLQKCEKDLEPYYQDIIDAVRDNDIEWLAMFYGNKMRALASVMRGVFRAPEGYQFVVADLASIEACVIAWLSGCTPMLNVFHNGLDIYKVFAMEMFHCTYEEVDKIKRNLSKPPVLGCGFRLSGGEEVEDEKTGDMKKTGLLGYAANMGISMTKDQADYAVKVYRDLYPEVVQYWYSLDKAIRQVITRGGRADVGPIYFERRDPFVRLVLPSGRALHYLRCKIEQRRTPWGEMRWSATFEGQEDEGGSKFWGRTTTHGGVIAENATQAVANDLLRSGIANAYAEGFTVVGESHDEIIALEKIGSRYNVPLLVQCMTESPEWAEGLPLNAAGFTTNVYKKD
jgi:DNA polymerase